MKPHNPTALALALAGSATLVTGDTTTVTATATRYHQMYHHPLHLGFATAPSGATRTFRERLQRGLPWMSPRSRPSTTRQLAAGRTWLRQRHRDQQRRWLTKPAPKQGFREYSSSLSAVVGDPDAGAGILSSGSGKADAEDTVNAAAFVAGPETPDSADQERWIRRMDVAVRTIWNQYYKTSIGDLGDMKESLGLFLAEANAALAASMRAEDIAARLETKLLENAERLDYHLDGDEPMVLYRLWLRGRPIDIYERDLMHSPRWVELIAETKRQMDARTVWTNQGMGTICYPTGEIFEGKVESLIHEAQQGAGGPRGPSVHHPTTGDAIAVDAQVVSEKFTNTAGVDNSIDDWLEPVDVTSVSGLVSLTIKGMDNGLSDEEAILRRHLRSPDFGNPLLVLATPSPDDDDGPMFMGGGHGDPAKARAEKELTEDQWENDERHTKEISYDRRRSHLDVYLICAAYRANRKAAREPGVNLCEEDARILDDMLREAAAATNSF